MIGGTRKDARILGSLRTADGQGIVRMEDCFDTTIEDLWSALTDPGRLVRWLGDVDGDLRVGGEFRAHFTATGWQGTGRVAACEPPRRLRVLTRDADEPDAAFHHVIEATLTGEGNRTLLVWEERGIPVNLIAEYAAGIQLHVEDLGDSIAGRERRDPAARWKDVVPAYRELAARILSS